MPETGKESQGCLVSANINGGLLTTIRGHWLSSGTLGEQTSEAKVWLILYSRLFFYICDTNLIVCNIEHSFHRWLKRDQICDMFVGEKLLYLTVVQIKRRRDTRVRFLWRRSHQS